MPGLHCRQASASFAHSSGGVSNAINETRGKEMKIKGEHYEALEAAIKPVMAQHAYSEYVAAGLSGKRYRWDCLHASGIDWSRDGVGTGTGGLCLYSYLDDSHIDTALRVITGTT